MLVKFEGFSLTPGDGITLAEFFDHLLALSDPAREHAFSGRQRLFLLERDSNPDLYTGLFVTIKDHKRYCELRNVGGRFRIKVSEVDADSNLMDFNFFVIHKQSFCGLYQHYFASCSLGQFMAFLREVWKGFKAERIRAEAARLLEEGRARRPDTAERRAKRMFKKTLRYTPYYKPEDFEQILRNMRKISQFEYEASTRVVPNNSFGPQNRNLRRVAQKMIFSNDAPVPNIAEQIAQFVAGQGIAKGKAVAIDPTDQTRSVYLAENIEHFGEFEFDRVAGEIELDLDHFSQSWVTSRLKEAVAANRQLFYDQ